MKAVAVTVTTTAAIVVPGIGASNYPQSAVLKSQGTLWVGGSDVDSTNGFPMAAGDVLNIDVINEPVYAVSGGSVVLNVLRRWQ